MGRLTRTSGAAAVILLLSGAALAQESPSSDAKAYFEIVSAYRDLDSSALRDIERLDRVTLSAVLNDVLRPGQKTGWTPEDFQAAGMLHTDVALGLMREGSIDAGVAHLNFAARLIDRSMGPSATYMAYAARWYEFAEAAVRPYAPTWADELPKRARTRFGRPGGADHALWKALQYERLAAFGPGIAPQAPMISGSPERLFEEVVEIAEADAVATGAPKADCYEAWLHLGRLRMNKADIGPAVDALRKAMDSPERRIRYLAGMFLGAIAERSADYTEAELRYRTAAATYPWAQSPLLALAHLLSRTAREAEARDALARQLARSTRMVVDPLWTYYLLPEELLEETLRQLRIEVTR